MIKGRCKTNLDGFDCSEVKSFVDVPRTGDYVQVKYRGYPRSLKVCSVTHMMKQGATGDPYPIIEVELNN